MAEKVENLLREFDLTEYEIRAFVTLLKLKIATAEQISEIGNIPLPRVYDTLSELKKKGFVLISKTRPKKFKPISPEKALNSLIKIKKDNFDQSIKNLEVSIKKIKNTLIEYEPIETSQEESITIWSTEKRTNVIKNIQELGEKAEKEILIFSGDFSWLSEVALHIRKAVKRGIKIRAIVFDPLESKEIEKNIRLAKKIGIDVRKGYKGLLRGQVIDGKTAYIAVKRSKKGINVIEGGKPGIEGESTYELMMFNNPSLVNAFKENFEFWWNKLNQ